MFPPSQVMRILSIVYIILLRHSRYIFADTTKAPYRLGISGSAPLAQQTGKATQRSSPTLPSLPSVKTILNNVSTQLNKYARYLRICVFLYYTRDSIDSIMEDCWEAVRDPDRVFGKQISRTFERKVVMRRTKRAETLRALVGAGYTPRLVWLFGLMLRGIVHCTALPKIFEPPIGFGAGAVAAARFAHREWLPCIMLGWYGSEYYWKLLFGVNGPPPNSGFDGVPIEIRRVRV